MGASEERGGGGEGSRRVAARRAEVGQSLQRLYDRLPPQALEAEMALLGAMILDPKVVSEVISVVKSPEDFHDQRHAHVFRAMVEVYDKTHAADLVHLVDSLRGRGVLDEVGGGDYLVKLAESVPNAASAPYYARVVADKARLRRLIDAAGEMIYEAYHSHDLGPEGARQVIDRAEASVFEIAQEDQIADPQRLSALLQQEMDRLDAAEGKGITGVATGYQDLDEILGGMQNGELLIVAARPSMGKTALALNIAEQIAFGGHTARAAPGDGPTVPVAVFSLEMSKSAVTQRLLSAASGVDSHRLRGGMVSDRDYADILRASDALHRAPIFIDDTPALTLLALRARARRLVAQHAVRCVVVDYLQLLSAPQSSRESRQVEVSAISRGVKALARELNIPVVCLSQLNRNTENREGNRPRMSDLRESGSIEQDADVVILLHREDYYHSQDPDWAIENPDKAGVAELIVAKQRNGPTGVVRLTWDSRSVRFRSHAGGHAPVDIPPLERAGAPARGAFAPSRPTGPVEGFRDGGGPDSDDLGGIPT